MCLAANNGRTDARLPRLPIDATKQYLGSMFCETCAARPPCYAHHVVKPKQP